MNKPAPKEPSMDEILSSIRQIIADDDATVAPRKPALAAPAAAAPVRSAPVPMRPAVAEVEPDTEPLPLTAEQILRETAAEDMGFKRPSFDKILAGQPVPGEEDDPPPLVDPEDIAFDPMEDDDEAEPEPVAVVPAPRPMPASLPERAAPRPLPRPVAQTAPMPDPHLSADLAERLLEPAASSAVKGAFSRLGNLTSVGNGVTLEDMAREMLRPMLKEWLDENLPAMVERLVEAEIARVSRGGF